MALQSKAFARSHVPYTDTIILEDILHNGKPIAPGINNKELTFSFGPARMRIWTFLAQEFATPSTDTADVHAQSSPPGSAVQENLSPPNPGILQNNSVEDPFRSLSATVAVPPAQVEKKEWTKQSIQFEDTRSGSGGAHAWVQSRDPMESNHILISCGDKRRDKHRFLLKCKDVLAREKVVSLLFLHGGILLVKFVADKLPTTLQDLRRKVDIDGTWQTQAMLNSDSLHEDRKWITPLGALNAKRPAVMGSHSTATAGAAGQDAKREAEVEHEGEDEDEGGQAAKRVKLDDGKGK